MTDLSRFVIDEHKVLLPHIDKLRIVADAIGTYSQHVCLRATDKIYEFLTGRLIPHMQVEEETLYPALAQLMGTPIAVASLSRDHTEINRLIGKMRELRAQIGRFGFAEDRANDKRRVLYSLHALLKLHLAKEEEIYLPIVDGGLGEAEEHRLFHDIKAITYGRTGLSS
jgi:iron-sulfur cluster repair protein YtfE (RIC family)